MNQNNNKINLQDYRHRYWIAIIFVMVCLLISALITRFMQSSFFQSMEAKVVGGGMISLNDLQQLTGIVGFSQNLIYVVVIISGVSIGLLFLKKYNEDWTRTAEVLDALVKGKKPEKFHQSETEFRAIYEAAEKIGEIYESYGKLIESIDQGCYENQLKVINQNEVIKEKSSQMLENLKNLTEESKMRLWINESLNEVSELMIHDRNDIEIFSSNILSMIIGKVNANMGAIYIIEDENPTDEYMEMINCYAYSRKKAIENRIYKGEGLVGRLWQEKKQIMLTDIPEDYCNIITGVGQALPNAILLLPIVLDQKIVGAIELGGFEIFKAEQIEFVQKAVNSFASIYSNIKTEENTKKLLEEAKQLSEETRASEEEIRQNMEELQAIQEELLRKEKETDKLMKDAKERENNLQKEIERLQQELSNA